MLGDNIFHGPGLGGRLRHLHDIDGGHVFAYRVANPSEYGVVEFDADGRAISLEEKPAAAAVQLRRARPVLLRPGHRRGRQGDPALRPRGAGDHRGQPALPASRAGSPSPSCERGTAWLDTGTFRSLHDAAEYVRVMEDRQGLKLACLEEIAWRNGWIDDGQLAALAEPLLKSGYGEYLRGLPRNPRFQGHG